MNAWPRTTSATASKKYVSAISPSVAPSSDGATTSRPNRADSLRSENAKSVLSTLALVKLRTSPSSSWSKKVAVLS